jgi:DNA-binding NarL/FixJ family response regulator
MIRVLIVDDQKAIQQFLKNCLENEPDLEIVGIASDGKQAIQKIEDMRPDVVVMDINMPEMDGLSATKIISDRFTSVRVLILSLYDDDEYLSEALEVGAKGYLFKNTPSEEIIIAIRSVYKGYFQLGPGLLEKYLYKLSMTPRLYAEVNKKINEAADFIDKNKNYTHMLSDVIRHVSKLENSVSTLRSLIYILFVVNFIVLFLSLSIQ